VAFVSKSRFIMVNYFFLFLLIPIYKGFNLGVFVKYTLIVSVFSVALYFGSKSVGFDVDRIVQERILEKKSGGMIKGNVGTRILAVKIFKDLFPKNPVFGKGKLHSFSKAGSRDFELLNALRGRSSQIHVGYLSLFYYYGILGGVIFLFSMFFLFRYTYRTGLLKNCWGPLFGVSQFLLTNITGVVLYLFIMGIMMSLIYNRYYLDQEVK
jgi:hypothetical protein